MKSKTITVPICWNDYSPDQVATIKAIFDYDGVTYTEDSYTTSMTYAIDMGRWCKKEYPGTTMHVERYCMSHSIKCIDKLRPRTDYTLLIMRFDKYGIESDDMVNFINKYGNVYTKNQLNEIFMSWLSGVDLLNQITEYDTFEHMRDLRHYLEAKEGKLSAECIIDSYYNCNIN